MSSTVLLDLFQTETTNIFWSRPVLAGSEDTLPLAVLAAMAPVAKTRTVATSKRRGLFGQTRGYWGW